MGGWREGGETNDKKREIRGDKQERINEREREEIKEEKRKGWECSNNCCSHRVSADQSGFNQAPKKHILNSPIIYQR